MTAGESKKARKRRLADVDPQDFMPGLLRVQNQPPTPFARAMLHTLLGKVSNRIINEVRGINRVVYDISGKPPATIEWE